MPWGTLYPLNQFYSFNTVLEHDPPHCLPLPTDCSTSNAFFILPKKKNQYAFCDENQVLPLQFLVLYKLIPT